MADRADLTGESSICCDPEYAPIRYHWCRFEGERTLVEAFESLMADEGLTETLLESFVGDFRARFRLVREGRVRPVDHVKGPMETETRFEMFELRWRFEVGTTREIRVRAYHVEPADLAWPKGSTVVGLHLHKKADDADQDAEIIAAGKRYFAAKAKNWGLREAG